MHVEIHDAALEARIQKQIYATGSASAEEALLHLLENVGGAGSMAHRQSRHNQRKNSARPDHGESVPEGELDA
jgi:hypothetical protein